MKEETWVPAPGWEGLYEVSDEGNVRRIAPRVDWQGKSTRIHSETGHQIGQNPERLLHPRIKSGYLQISPTRGAGSTTWVTVHSLVALAFIGPRPSRRHTVNHLNGNKFDNRADNLEWATHRKQQRHAASLGLKRHTQYQRLTDEQAREVYNTIGQISGRQWAEQLGVHQVLISSIRTGATYRWATGAPPNRRRGQWFPCTEECECRCHQRRK